MFLHTLIKWQPKVFFHSLWHYLLAKTFWVMNGLMLSPLINYRFTVSTSLKLSRLIKKSWELLPECTQLLSLITSGHYTCRHTLLPPLTFSRLLSSCCVLLRFPYFLHHTLLFGRTLDCVKQNFIHLYLSHLFMGDWQQTGAELSWEP